MTGFGVVNLKFPLTFGYYSIYEQFKISFTTSGPGKTRPQIIVSLEQLHLALNCGADQLAHLQNRFSYNITYL